MAKLTDDLKNKILADFHTGYFSIRDLALKYEIGKSTIAKLVKELEPKNKEKVDALVAIKSELSLQSGQEVDSVHKVVDKRTQHLLLFQNSALKNQKKANELLELTDDMKDIESHARITKTNKETVLGKEIDTIINNTNATQNNLPTQINIIRDI